VKIPKKIVVHVSIWYGDYGTID